MHETDPVQPKALPPFKSLFPTEIPQAETYWQAPDWQHFSTVNNYESNSNNPDYGNFQEMWLKQNRPCGTNTNYAGYEVKEPLQIDNGSRMRSQSYTGYEDWNEPEFAENANFATNANYLGLAGYRQLWPNEQVTGINCHSHLVNGNCKETWCVQNAPCVSSSYNEGPHRYFDSGNIQQDILESGPQMSSRIAEYDNFKPNENVYYTFMPDRNPLSATFDDAGKCQHDSFAFSETSFAQSNFNDTYNTNSCYHNESHQLLRDSVFEPEPDYNSGSYQSNYQWQPERIPVEYNYTNIDMMDYNADCRESGNMRQFNIGYETGKMLSTTDADLTINNTSLDSGYNESFSEVWPDGAVKQLGVEMVPILPTTSENHIPPIDTLINGRPAEKITNSSLNQNASSIPPNFKSLVMPDTKRSEKKRDDTPCYLTLIEMPGTPGEPPSFLVVNCSKTCPIDNLPPKSQTRPLILGRKESKKLGSSLSITSRTTYETRILVPLNVKARSNQSSANVKLTTESSNNATASSCNSSLPCSRMSYVPLPIVFNTEHRELQELCKLDKSSIIASVKSKPQNKSGETSDASSRSEKV